MQWLFSDKTRYKKNKGIVFKVGINNTDYFVFEIGNEYTFDEIVDRVLKLQNVEYLYFSIDYSNKFYHDNISFKKADENSSTLDHINH